MPAGVDRLPRPLLSGDPLQHPLCRPPSMNLLQQPFRDLPARRVVSPVIHLPRVIPEVEQLVGPEFVVVVQLPRAAPDHARRLVPEQAVELAERLVRPVRRRRPSQKPRETPPGGVRNRPCARDIQQRRSRVDQAGHGVHDAAAGEPARPGDDHRHARRAVVETALPPHAVLARPVPQVRAVDDHGTVALRRRPHAVPDPAHVPVHFRDQPVVGRQPPPVLLRRQVEHPPALPPFDHRRMKPVQVGLRHRGRRGDALVVIVKQLLRTDQGVSRQDQAAD